MFLLLQKFGDNWEIIESSDNKEVLLNDLISLNLNEYVTNFTKKSWVDFNDVLESIKNDNIQHCIVEIKNSEILTIPKLFEEPKNRLRLLRAVRNENYAILDSYRIVKEKMEKLDKQISDIESEIGY